MNKNYIEIKKTEFLQKPRKRANSKIKRQAELAFELQKKFDDMNQVYLTKLNHHREVS